MYAFNYHRPSSLNEVASLLAQNEDAKIIAGGMTLVPTMKQRLAAPSMLIDLAGIEELRGVCPDGERIVIGAMTKHYEAASSQDLRKAIPALADLAADIGDTQVRNRGTIGGSIANNDPAADYPAALVALGATVKTNTREIAAEDFFTGLLETALEPDEIVVSVGFPIPEKACYAKFHNPASRYAMVGVFVARMKDGQVRVSVTGAGPCVFRQKDMEQALAGNFSPDALDGIKVSPSGMNEDLHGSAEYRAHLVGVMAKRAVQNCK